MRYFTSNACGILYGTGDYMLLVKYAKYFDVVVLGDGDILYAGDLLDEFIQILFNSKKNPIREISIIIRPSKKLEIDTNKWFVFNDEIKFTVNGFYKTSIIDFDDKDNFDDESFRADWS